MGGGIGFDGGGGVFEKNRRVGGGAPTMGNPDNHWCFYC